MTWSEGQQDNAAIARVQGSPNNPLEEGEGTKWAAFKKWISSWFRKGDRLGDAYLTAKVAEEGNNARKTFEEAGEAAAKREAQELNNLHMDFALIDDIFDENQSDAARILKLAKYMEHAPELAEQVAKVNSVYELLRIKRGVSVQILNSDDAVTPSLPPSKGQQA